MMVHSKVPIKHVKIQVTETIDGDIFPNLNMVLVLPHIKAQEKAHYKFQTKQQIHAQS